MGAAFSSPPSPPSPPSAAAAAAAAAAPSSSLSSSMDRLWLTGISGIRSRAALGSVDLRAPDAGCGGPGAPVVTDQQEEGACVLHAIKTAYECARIRRGGRSPPPPSSLGKLAAAAPSFDPDEWFDRARAHGRVTRPEDAGLTFAEAAAALADLGGFPIAPAPPGCIRDGGGCLAGAAAGPSYTWARIGISADHLALVIAKLRVPVILGFGVPKDSPAAAFLDTPSGTDMVLPLFSPPHPTFFSKKTASSSSSSSSTMYHAVILMGYDADADTFLVQNSWGPKWGTQGGYFWIPASAVDDPAFAIDAMILF